MRRAFLAVLGVLFVGAAVPGCGSGGSRGDDSAGQPDGSGPADTGGGDVTGPGDVAGPDGPRQELPRKDCQFHYECDDGNPCTHDICGDAGTCEHPFNQAQCDDGDPCTTGDQCTGGSCQGQPLPCDDGNACTVDSCKQGICHSKPSPEDACALQIMITSPPAGAQLVGPGPVMVEGQVISPAGAVVSLVVAGLAVQPGPGGQFSVPVSPLVGVTIVEATVKDEWDRAARAARAFITAGQYHAAGSFSAPTLLSEPGGVARAWLRWDVFDDDDIGDLDDVATLAWLVLSALDIDALIPHPLTAEGEGPGVAWCEWTVDVTDVSYVMGDVDLVPIAGGMYLTASLSSFSAWVSAVADWCPDALGWIFADELAIEATILGEVPGGCKLELDLVDPNVEIIGLSVDMTGGTASLFDWLINWFSEALAAKIEEEVETWFAQKFVDKCNALLSDLTDYTTDFQLPGLLGNPPGNPMALRICASALDFDESGGGAGSDGGVGTDKATDQAAQGSLARLGCSTAPMATAPSVSLPHVDQIEVAVAEDVLNQMLFSLWWGGHMNVALSSDGLDLPLADYGLDSGSVETDPLLPPVLTTCSADGQAEAQIGDLHLLIDLAGETMSGSLELLASGRVAVMPVLTAGQDGKNAVGLEIVGVRQLAAEVLSTEGNLEGSEALIESLVSAVIVDLLLGEMLSDALGAYPIPEVDLGEYVSVVPAGSVVSFNPKTAEFMDGYLMLGGELVAP